MIVTLPDADAGFSRSKIQRKGLRRGSFRIVIETNKRAQGGYQLVSDGFVKGEIEVEPGACIAWQDPERDWRIGMVLPNKKIEWRTDWLTNARMPTIRKAAEAILSNPRREMRKVLEKLRKQLRSAESDAQTTRAKDNDVGGPEDGQADRSRGTEADRSDQKVLKAKSALEALESGRIPDFPVTRSHPPASWPSAANSSICRTYRKTAGEESRRRSPVANRWMRP